MSGKNPSREELKRQLKVWRERSVMASNGLLMDHEKAVVRASEMDCMSSKKSVKEVEEQLARLRTQTIMASNGLMVGDNQTVGRISNINKQKADMSYEFSFDDDMDGKKASAWRQLLDKISPKGLKDPVLKITMTRGLERRIRSAMFIGDIDSVAQFCKMAFTLLEKAIDAKASGGRMVILEKDGKIREIQI